MEWGLRHFHPDGSISEIKDLVIILERAGMVNSEVFVQQYLVTLDPTDYEMRINLIEACIRMASQIGVKMLNVFSGPAPWIPNSPRLGIDISERKA